MQILDVNVSQLIRYDVFLQGDQSYRDYLGRIESVKPYRDGKTFEFKFEDGSSKTVARTDKVIALDTKYGSIVL